MADLSALERLPTGEKTRGPEREWSDRTQEAIKMESSTTSRCAAGTCSRPAGPRNMAERPTRTQTTTVSLVPALSWGSKASCSGEYRDGGAALAMLRGMLSASSGRAARGEEGGGEEEEGERRARRAG